MSAPSRVAWLPPLLVGAAAAATAEMALGLLLYVRAGFVTALTLILCVQTAALACGLWMAPREVVPPWPGVRRAWLLLVLAYVGGAVLAVSWEALGGLAQTWTTRGLGLGMLTALPLYATGLILGAPALTDGAVTPGPWAMFGALVGFAGVGFAGAGLHLAASVYVASMAVVAAAALIHNAVLETNHRHRGERTVAGPAWDGEDADEPLASAPPSGPR